MIELFAGLHGWGEGAVAEGFRVIGFDIEDMCGVLGHPRPAGIQLVIQDVLTIHGRQFKNAALIVASPPCQEFSYMAMPWSKAKEKARKLREGEDDPKRLTALFDACFRLQQEASDAAGRYIPLVVENVRGAQKWVGRSRWNFGSFHLWGDVPALMPMTANRAAKAPGQDWNRFKQTGEVSPDWKLQGCGGIKNAGGSWFNIAHNTTSGVAANPVNEYKTHAHVNKRDGHSHTRHLTNPAEHDLHERGVKGFTPHGGPLGKNVLGRKHGSKSPARKAASAMIAKIPFVLSSHIARCWKPDGC